MISLDIGLRRDDGVRNLADALATNDVLIELK